MAKYRKHLLAAVQQELRCNANEASLAVDAVLDAISELTIEHDMLILRGFGTFATRKRRASMTTNPRTGQPMPVPASIRLGFKQSREKSQ